INYFQVPVKEEVEDSFEIIPEKKQTASPSYFSSYIKSYSETQIKSTTLDHTWKIEQFMHLCKIYDTFFSPSFSESGQYTIEVNVSHRIDQFSNTVRFYILTNKAFHGSCVTTIKYPLHTVLSSKSIMGRISNKTLLIELPRLEFKTGITNTSLLVHCKFDIFRNLVSDTIQMKLLPPSAVFSKDVRYLQDSTLDEIQSTNEKSITFIIGKEQYVISKKLLYATNSNYFKKICFTQDKKEKDMTNELKNYELQAFKMMLIYIKTSSVELRDYDMLKKLLIIAHRYDVVALKLTCEHYLLHYITIQNAVELVQLAFSTNAKFLEIHSTAFIKFNITEIMDTKEFQNLPKEYSNKMIESL
ncbi:KL41B protein, partial [Acromyrmex insinuator]